VVRLLLDRGADPSVRQEHGWTPLMVLACKGATSILELLLQHPSCCEEEVLYEALWTACCFGQVGPMLPLLRAGADFTRPNKRGMRMVDFARSKGHQDCVRVLEVSQ
jgi:ankyrin repeat protein